MARSVGPCGLVKRLATILARAGSKGIPGKNLRTLGGVSLVALAVEQARRSSVADIVVVSSNSEEILEEGRKAGAHLAVTRTPDLAGDTISKLPGIRHALRACEAAFATTFDTIVDLAATSPFRSDEDVVGAVHLLEESPAALVLSASVAKDNPYFNIVEADEDGALHLSKSPSRGVRARQKAPSCYALNGAVYAWQREELLREEDAVVRPAARLYVMPEDRSLDVDSEFELRLAELLWDSVTPMRVNGATR